ncbi:MAG: hypothetical protein JXO22_06510, partial [Phycisphaerae bacterium]|nr:hypothetical protein [Phycisphaerae bacterium]
AWLTVHRTFGAIESITARCWNDLIELVIPEADRGISGVFGDEAAVTHLLDASVSIRRAWATDDVVVGLTARRDRLVVLNANRPGREAEDIPLARQVGHSIQDACIVANVSRDVASDDGVEAGES